MALGVAVIESDGSNFLSSADRPPRSQMNYQQSTHFSPPNAQSLLQFVVIPQYKNAAASTRIRTPQLVFFERKENGRPPANPNNRVCDRRLGLWRLKLLPLQLRSSF
jgi:hypothetical protein